MNSVVRPRRLSHRGVVDAVGFVVDLQYPGSAAARRRILAAWVPGSTVSRYNDLLVLLLPNAEPVACDRAPGLPLARYGTLLSAVPLDSDEQAALSSDADGSIVIAEAGAAVMIPADALTRDAPAAWLDLSGFTVAQTTSLAHPPDPVATSIEAVTLDARSELARISGDPDGRASLLAALRRDAAPPGLVSRIARATFDRIDRLVKKWESEAESRGEALPQPRRKDGPQNRGVLARLQQKTRQVLWRSQLGSALGRSHAKYLMRMIEMFDQGDTLEGLRRAIPLTRDGSTSEGWPRLGRLAFNNTLQLQMNQRPMGGSIGIDTNFMEMLRERYRKAARQLEAQGKIEEAAYVLADLLTNPQEAVDLLERHGRLALAAQLAEARSLPADHTIRLWFLAGNHERAVAIAKYSGAFSGAITQMETRGMKDQAEELRLLWTEVLIFSSNYTAAVDVLWPVKQERQRTLPWIEMLVQQGGPTGARMLARLLALKSNADESLWQRAIDLLDGEHPEEASHRLAFAVELPLNDADRLRPLARAAIRSLVRDEATAHNPAIRKALTTLLTFADDGALRVDARADRNTATPRESLATDSPPVEVRIDAGDAGAADVKDAVLLDNGRMLVALGEVGVRMIGRSGTTIAHFNQPAHSLVVSDDCTSVITVAHRGDIVRLGRISLTERRATDWCEAELTTWANSFDGLIWVAATSHEVLVIDATASSMTSLWRWSDPELQPTTINRAGGTCAFIMYRGSTGRSEAWRVELSTLTLRDRKQLPMNAIASVRATSHLKFNQEPTSAAALFINEQAAYTHDLDTSSLDGLDMTDSWTCLATVEMPDSTRRLTTCRLFDNASRTLRASIAFLDSTVMRTRLNAAHLLAFDNKGRLVALDLANGTIVRELRIS